LVLASIVRLSLLTATAAPIATEPGLFLRLIRIAAAPASALIVVPSVASISIGLAVPLVIEPPVAVASIFPLIVLTITTPAPANWKPASPEPEELWKVPPPATPTA
jgi:hypothetical protein